MLSVIDALREVIGTPQFYLESGALDYGAITEYIIAGTLVLVVVASIFRFCYNWFN